jgi:hypothetical protein
MLRKIQCTQRSMERCLLGIIIRDRKRNTWVRSMTKVTDTYSRTSEKVAMGWTHSEKNGQNGSEKYWNGIRDDVKESKVDRVDDGLMN